MKNFKVIENHHEILLADQHQYKNVDFEEQVESLKKIEDKSNFYYQVGLLYDLGINFFSEHGEDIGPCLLEKEFGLTKQVGSPICQTG